MKPITLHEDMVTEGNLDGFGESVKMEISAEDSLHIMAVLTNMYSDRILACIREYSTNARDANIEAGNGDKPIRIGLPGALSQYFSVSDNGIGMNAETIRKVYSQYGRSTKRDSDSYNGVLGIGSKSALTYAPTFTVTSVKDGIRTVVIVTTDEDGMGQMRITSETETSESNGTTVTIPVKQSDTRDFLVKAQRFFRWWEPGTFTGVNAQHPTPMDTFGDVSVYSKSDVGEDLIVMGGVAYPIPYEGGLAPFDRNFSIVHFAEMGAVKFAPSREALMTTKRVKATVDAVRDTFVSRLSAEWQTKVDAVKSAVDAYVVGLEAEASYPKVKMNLTYKGRPIPKADDEVFKPLFDMVEKRDYRGVVQLDPAGNPIMVKKYRDFWTYTPREREREYGRSSFAISFQRWTTNKYDYSDIVWVTGFPKTVNSNHRTILRSYAYKQTETVGVFWMTREDFVPGDGWLEGIRTVSWDEVKQVVRDGITKVAKKAEEFDVWEKSQTFVKSNRVAIAPDAKILYVTSAVVRESEGHLNMRGVVDWSVKAGWGDRVVVIDRNRHEKFAKEHPNAKPFFEGLREWAESWYAGLRDDVAFGLHLFNANIPHIFSQTALVNAAVENWDRFYDEELVIAFRRHHKKSKLIQNPEVEKAHRQINAIESVWRRCKTGDVPKPNFSSRKGPVEKYLNTLDKIDDLYSPYIPGLGYRNENLDKNITVMNALFVYRKKDN